MDVSVIFALYQEIHTRAFLLINSLKWIQTMDENHPVQNEIKKINNAPIIVHILTCVQERVGFTG